MSVAEAQTQGAIRADLNYIVDTGKPPVSIIDWPEMEHEANPPQYETKEVMIRDGRPLKDTFALDVHGFVFADHPTKVADFTDENQRKEIYDPEIQALIKKHSGASEVLVFDHTIRVGDEATRTNLKARAPVRGVHNDYTEKSAPRRLRDILGDAEAEKRMQKRFAIIQVWRPIRGNVYADPLAISDGRSIPREGFILNTRRYKDRTAETYHIAYNPNHEWFYFPEMTRDEALVFKVFDSNTGVTEFTAHTAFEDPNTPPNAPFRESIETRTFAFWS
jgi:hypothetical protein